MFANIFPMSSISLGLATSGMARKFAYVLSSRSSSILFLAAATSTLACAAVSSFTDN